jgi:hypothetical protein
MIGIKVFFHSSALESIRMNFQINYYSTIALRKKQIDDDLVFENVKYE